MEKPIFLIGGFGGVTRSVCRLIMDKAVPEELSFDWQASMNPGLEDMVSFAASKGVDYKQLYHRGLEILMNADLRNGLSAEENARLSETPFADEVIHLILKGMGRC